VTIPYPLDLLASIFLGLVFGSFCTALVSRDLRDISIISEGGQGHKAPARSACPHCGHVLSARDLVPFFSWLLLRGKCRYCRKPIGWIYPAIELACLAMCLGIYAGWGLTLPGFILMVSVPFLAGLFVIDLQTLLLPDRLNGALFVLGLLYVIVSASSEGGNVQMILAQRAGAAALYSGVLFLCGFILSRLLRKEALGLGDVKFFAVAGLYLGLSVLPFYFMISGVYGVLLGVAWRILQKGAVFPFGPAIILALYTCLLLQRFSIFPY
jgi:prepilin signal peptidase PulO-like enzyme (type II secretory pathway)